MTTPPAATPEPPYYAVIFVSVRSPGDDAAYAAMAERMAQLSAAQPGYLGIDTARGADGLGITVSYWRTEADIARWRADAEHREAQRQGRAAWYEQYEVRVCRVERAHRMPPTPSGS